jgi:glycosyltransferase involved in cell wall biosynthesis
MRPWHHRVDRYIAVSAPVAKACASLTSLDQTPIQVIPPFLSDFSLNTIPGDRPAFLPPTGDFVMFAGALGPHKGVDILLRAWAGFDPSVPLVLLGLPRPDTPLHFPEGVVVVENVPHDEVMRAWAHCAVAVVPSLWPDPCPVVTLEAMAAGRPVIASAVGGLPDLVLDGTTGVLVPPGDPQRLRESILQLLADPVRRAAMGDAGRRRAAAYSASIVVPEIEKVYQDVISNRPKPVAHRERNVVP